MKNIAASTAAFLCAAALALPSAPPQAAPAQPAKPGTPAGGSPAKVDSRGFQLDDRGFRVSPKPGVFVLPWKGGVGQTANAKEITEIGAEADKWGPGQTIVLDIDSPGGRVTEIFKIIDAIAKVRERHRMVVWVREAISAAAITSMQCEEIYFRKVGALGAAMVINGADSAPPEIVERFRTDVAPVIERNGRPRAVFEAMVLANAVLTYTKDPVTGKVTWHDKVTGLPGEVVLSDEKDNLTFNASNALDSGFSRGTADSEQELAKLLGLQEWHEISDAGRKASATLVRNYESCEKELQLLNQSMGVQRSSQVDQLKAQIKFVETGLSWAKRCPPCVTNVFGAAEASDVVERLNKELKDLKRQLNDARKAGG